MTAAEIDLNVEIADTQRRVAEADGRLADAANWQRCIDHWRLLPPTKPGETA